MKSEIESEEKSMSCSASSKGKTWQERDKVSQEKESKAWK
jgi:hypothetical protein